MVKVKGTYTWHSASSCIITSEVLRYGTYSQGMSQFYLLSHTFNPQLEWAVADFGFPAIAGTHLPTPGGMEGWVGLGCDVTDVAPMVWQERKFLEQQQENTEAAMRRLADQHRTAVAQLERESLQLKHQLLRGLYSVSPSRHTHVHPPRPLTEPAVCN